VARFVADHPTTKMLALAFLVLDRRFAVRLIQIPPSARLQLLFAMRLVGVKAF